MLIIRHRINTVRELRAVPTHMGVEVDLRCEGDRLILQHDPFKSGESFDDLLKNYAHAFMVVNVKSEGLEEPALTRLKSCGVSDYFFLDLSFPALMKLTKQGERDIAARFSEYEPLEQCLAVRGKVRWVWVDCFSRLALDRQAYVKLKKHFKLCIVSPELQGHPPEQIDSFKKALSDYEIDAVCTKYPDRWQP